MSQLFPGSEVRIDSPCLCCGEPLSVTMRNGGILDLEPDTAVGHVNLPVAKWGAEGWPDT